MTMIREIAGIVKMEGAAGIKQRAALVKPASFIDTVNLSEGEMMVAIMTDRYRMLADYYPEVNAYHSAVQLGENALYNGLHSGIGASAFTGMLNPKTFAMASAIVRGKGKANPASGLLSWADKKRTPARGIGDPLVPQLNCEELYPNYPIPPGQNEVTWVQMQTAKWQKCKKENDYRTLFNQHLEKISHHPLYEWLGNPNLQPTAAGVKALQHKLLVDVFASDSEINRNLIREWMHNGVMRNNTAQGAPPLSPAETIQAVKEGKTLGVGDFGLTTVLIIIAAIGAAAANAKTFVNVVKGNQSVGEGLKNVLVTTLSFIGKIGWGAETSDWETTTTTTTPTTTTTTPTTTSSSGKIDPVLLGGGAVALLGLVYISNENGS